eukprot:gene22224-biopygen14752
MVRKASLLVNPWVNLVGALLFPTRSPASHSLLPCLSLLIPSSLPQDVDCQTGTGAAWLRLRQQEWQKGRCGANTMWRGPPCMTRSEGHRGVDFGEFPATKYGEGHRSRVGLGYWFCCAAAADAAAAAAAEGAGRFRPAEPHHR